jgi:hypothetical protein
MARDPAGELDSLCRLATSRAERLGHRLAAWETPEGEETIGRSAVCGRCGSTAYVRVEGGLKGMAGEALTAACRAVSA